MSNSIIMSDVYNINKKQTYMNIWIFWYIYIYHMLSLSQCAIFHHDDKYSNFWYIVPASSCIHTWHIILYWFEMMLMVIDGQCEYLNHVHVSNGNCIFIYLYVCSFVSICMFMYVCLYVCMYVCMYVCIYVCMYVCMYVCIYVCMYVCMYACMYVCMTAM